MISAAYNEDTDERNNIMESLENCAFCGTGNFDMGNGTEQKYTVKRPDGRSVVVCRSCAKNSKMLNMPYVSLNAELDAGVDRMTKIRLRLEEFVEANKVTAEFCVRSVE